MTTLATDDLHVIRRELETRLRQLNEEIRGYPQPIARCDAQLAGLIEQRDEVSRALAALRELTAGTPRILQNV